MNSFARSFKVVTQWVNAFNRTEENDVSADDRHSNRTELKKVLLVILTLSNENIFSVQLNSDQKCILSSARTEIAIEQKSEFIIYLCLAHIETVNISHKKKILCVFSTQLWTPKIQYIYSLPNKHIVFGRSCWRVGYSLVFTRIDSANTHNNIAYGWKGKKTSEINENKIDQQ